MAFIFKTPYARLCSQERQLHLVAALPRCAKIFLFFLLVPLFLLTGSCAGGKSSVTKKAILKGKLAISVVKKSRNDYDLYKIKMQHPYDLTSNEVFSKLISLRYEIFSIGGENKKIFDKKLARHLSPYFVKAFKKAKKNELIRFDIRSRRGSINGDMFIYEGKLNLRFESIHSVPFQSEDAGTTIENWTLMLHKGEKYHKISKLLHKEALENWIILPLKTASIRHKPDEERVEMEAKFNRLRFLLDKGIISKEEYDMKKKELMEKYF